MLQVFSLITRGCFGSYGCGTSNGGSAFTVITVIIAWLLLPSMAFADEGDPIAVTRVDGGLEVSTFWGSTLTVRSGDGSVRSGDDVESSEAGVVSLGSTYNHLYFRLPNEAEPQWTEYSLEKADSPHSIHVQSVGGSDEFHPLMIQSDGCKILMTNSKVLLPESDSVSDVDLLVVVVGAEANSAGLQRLAQRKDITGLVLISQSANADSRVEELIQTLATDERKHRSIQHSTLAVSSAESQRRQLFTLGSEAWKMPEELEQAFLAMEKACSDSQSVFEKLSVDQMNFKPANGTHTPRWNAEHMMGRQLVFFSQIYNKIDPTIKVMDWNPKQNPEDYVAAHPDWTGAEEARQMERVSRFTRRFAFLLDGVAIDQRAPGSRWPSLGALLKQMQRHYAEHTANTEKKFLLSDWPKE